MNFKKAQSLAEYAILVFLVIAAVVGMQVYLKRGLQARFKTFVDGAGNYVGLRQYEPYYIDSNITTQQLQKTKITHKPAEGIALKRELLPAAKDSQGNYIEGNVLKRSGKVTTGGLMELGQDDEWEK